MIEKLNLEEVNNPGEATLKAFSILNQLVDAVNVLQAQVAILQEHAHPTAKTESTETPTISKMENVSFGTGRRIDISYIDDVDNDIDTYAEQRKWIGCVCRFRHRLGVTPTYGILGKISPDSGFPYYKKDTDTYWKYCEPVKPDDDIIYKGE